MEGTSEGSPPVEQSPGGTRRPLPAVPVKTRNSLLKGQKTRSNTTSSVFAKNTPSKPDVVELITCLTSELGEQMQRAEESKYAYADDMFDERLYDPAATGARPTSEAVRAFVKAVFKEAEVGEEVIVMAYVYLTRLTGCSPVRLAASNWKLLVLACFMLASKVWEEEAVWNEDFLSLFPAISVKKFAAVELKMLNLMQFEVCVKASSYAEAYFALTSKSTAKRDWKKKPLSPDEARDLEIRTLGLQSRAKNLDKAKRRNSDASHVKELQKNVILG